MRIFFYNFWSSMQSTTIFCLEMKSLIVSVIINSQHNICVSQQPLVGKWILNSKCKLISDTNELHIRNVWAPSTRYLVATETARTSWTCTWAGGIGRGWLGPQLTKKGSLCRSVLKSRNSFQNCVDLYWFTY